MVITFLLLWHLLSLASLATIDEVQQTQCCFSLVHVEQFSSKQDALFKLLIKSPSLGTGPLREESKQLAGEHMPSEQMGTHADGQAASASVWGVYF